jgi:hypothetical protein
VFFVFHQLPDKPRPWLLLLGSGVIAFLSSVGLVVLPLTHISDFKTEPDASAVTIVYTPKVLRAHPPSKATADSVEGKLEGHGSLPPATASSKRQIGAISLHPGSAIWRALVRRGKEVQFEVWAEKSLPVLAAYDITLAIDVRRPRGTTTLFNVNTKLKRVETPPPGAIIRELTEMPFVRELEEARRDVERELGVPAKIFACYTPELYSVLRGVAAQVLSERGIAPAAVGVVRVGLRWLGGRNFEATLVSYS